MTNVVENVRKIIKGSNLFVFGIPGSFYDVLFPENFVDIAIYLC